MILYYIFLKIGIFFHVEYVCKNIVAILLNMGIDCIVALPYLYMVNELSNYSFGWYIIVLVTMWVVMTVLNGLVDWFYIVGNYEQRYLYLCEVKYLKTYLIHIIAVLSGIASAYIAKYQRGSELLGYMIMPLIFFWGRNRCA